MRRFALLFILGIFVPGFFVTPGRAASPDDVRKIVLHLLECKGYTIGTIRCVKGQRDNDAVGADFVWKGIHYSVYYGGSYHISYESGPDPLDPTSLDDILLDRPQPRAYTQEERFLQIHIGDRPPYDHMRDQGLSGKVAQAGFGGSREEEGSVYAAERYDKAIADILSAFTQARAQKEDEARFMQSLFKLYPQ